MDADTRCLVAKDSVRNVIGKNSDIRRRILLSNVGCPSNDIVSSIQSSVSPSVIASSEATLGSHLARRLVQIGVSDVFSVPGDFNLTLLDHLIAEPGLKNIGCCNEPSARYAADGHARSRGVGACVVTFTVGELSVLNAIAGAYSENLPVICIVGGPYSNDDVHPTVIEVDDEEIGAFAAHSYDSTSTTPVAPAVFIGGTSLGGLESLVALHLSGHLIPRLAGGGSCLWG
ncbi:hypothetical protein VitviT2T_007265 [Vitis vinifera]|uniref:pyruvate decarboxylase n=1 Tax=Vitis vinifera TaxID=29760 RepID=A0ABY9C128_VITVI|nr:hypothetical protein VitviT2T_007265 [Vitis vinifera]